jgi:serine/threonine protein kinase/Tfp pilus assembly protein PilF
MLLASGTRLGPYEILAPLGAGGMGEVYRAQDTRLGRDVAIKILPEAFASSPDRLARFEREARTVAGLNHPNIVVLYSIEEQEGIRFLTMELIEGQDLSTWIVPGGLSVARVLEMAIPLADALVAAHEKRVVHRDLKPANVMLSRDGRLKVLDFGLAKLSEIGGDLDPTRALAPSLSRPGQVMGTASYMSPEQVRGEEADARSDLFAFGVVLYELATGRRPFEGRSAAEVGAAILRDRPKPLASVRLDLPADLTRIVERCLEKNPRQRFQTALDVANELRGLALTLERGTAERSRPPADRIVSIAVLPFVNRSASADDEYFSDGLADELLHVLAKIRGLRVAARTSAFHFKGKDATIAEVGEALRVDTVLEGSVRKVGARVRISVQLVQVAGGYPLWSESYDRTLDDIFALQDEIAQSVVKELRRTLLGEVEDTRAIGEVRAEVSRAAKGRSSDPEAYRLFLQARHLIERYTQADTAGAIEYLERALELDPEFALAWAELSRARSTQAIAGWRPLEDAFAEARQAAERALAIEPRLGEAHGALAFIQASYDWDWPLAAESYRRALELAPGDVSIMHRAAALAVRRGEIEEAVALLRRAIEQDPLSASAYHTLGVSLTASYRFLEGEQEFRNALALAPRRIVTHTHLALNLLLQGRLDEATQEVAKEPEGASRPWGEAIVEWARGHRAEAGRALGELVDKHASDSAYQIAEVFAMHEHADDAFAWLERAYEQRDGGLAGLVTSPRLRALRGDPRWDAFLRKLGLAPS